MTTWHLDDDLIAGYVSGSTGRAHAASVETHLLSCAECRFRLNAGAPVPSVRLDRIWDEVIDVVDRPRTNPLERLLRRMGVSDVTARLLATTHAVGLAWVFAVAGVLGMAAILAGLDPHDDTRLIYLGVAPLAPVLGVALSFSRSGDPAREVAVAAPYSAVRLVLIRTLAVLMASSLFAAAGALAFRGHDAVGLAWLVPSLALTGLTLVLSGWFEPEVAAGVVTAGWVALVLFARDQSGTAEIFGAIGQVGWATIAAASALLLALRRDRLALLGGAL